MGLYWNSCTRFTSKPQQLLFGNVCLLEVMYIIPLEYSFQILITNLEDKDGTITRCCDKCGTVIELEKETNSQPAETTL